MLRTYRRVLFSVLKSAEGGQPFAVVVGHLQAVGVPKHDIWRGESAYVGHYSISVPARFGKRAARCLFGA